ncbi:hypothetical protein MD484_g8065, partial [Candolleomyces efflorescens]
MLPPLADYDYAKNLRANSFPHLDAFMNPDKRHLFFRLMRVFRTEYIVLSLMIAIQVVAGFASPFGVRNLLQYAQPKIRKHPVKEIPIRPHMVLTKNCPTVAEVSKPPPVTMLASEEEEELMDALSPVYDQLKLKKAWWFLEIIPLQLRYQRGNNTWVTYFGLNRGKPRFIPRQRAHGLKVHRSVKLRMEAEYEDDVKRRKGKKYDPRPEFKVEPTWVD